MDVRRTLGFVGMLLSSFLVASALFTAATLTSHGSEANAVISDPAGSGAPADPAEP